LANVIGIEHEHRALLRLGFLDGTVPRSKAVYAVYAAVAHLRALAFTFHKTAAEIEYTANSPPYNGI